MANLNLIIVTSNPGLRMHGTMLYLKRSVQWVDTYLLRQQCRFYYKANDGVLPRKDSRRVLSATRRELANPLSGSIRRIMLPPFVSPGELRILLGIDYKSALALCQVKLYQQKYFWRDSEGRTFETANKRKVLVPFSLIAHPIRLFGMEPVLVDPEPQIESSSDQSTPVVSLIGVSLQGQSHVFGSTLDLFEQKITLLALSAKSPRSVVGRSIAHADVVLATEESRFEIEDLVRHIADAPRVTFVDPTITEEVIGESLTCRRRTRPVACPTATEFAKETRRTDILVDAHKAPSSWAVILDVEKSMQQGTCALILVKSGIVRVGSHFVAGSGFGKVITMICASSGSPLQFATAGMVVRVGRLIRNEEYTGDFAPDDNLFVFASRERAWRLAFHRQRIEWLNSFQTDGPPLAHLGFELDSSVAKAPPEDRIGDTNAEKAVQFGVTFERFSEYLENGSILVPPCDAKAAAESARVETRWKQRQDARIAAKREAMATADMEKKQMHELRQLIHKGSIDEEKRVPRETRTEVAEPLPLAKPVVPVIVKTKSVSQFDAVLDELELLEKEFGVKVPVVHGGIGPVCPTDVVHAEIESKFGPCCIYSLDVETLPECRANTGIDVVGTESVDDLIGHVRVRIANLKRRSGRNAYMKKLNSRR